MTGNGSTVMAIDDDEIHLSGLTSGLGRNGVTCRAIHFTGAATVVPRCPGVRIILADLHLGAGVLSSDHSTDFSTIGHLLEDRISPSGPYCIILWTMYADQAAALAAFLERLHNVPRPVVVRALDKAVHLDAAGNLRDEGALMRELRALAKGWLCPEGALALAGAWGDIDDREIDALVGEIYASRRRDAGRRLERVMYLLDTDILSNLMKRKPSRSLEARIASVPAAAQFASSITLDDLIFGAKKKGSSRLMQRGRRSRRIRACLCCPSMPMRLGDTEKYAQNSSAGERRSGCG